MIGDVLGIVGALICGAVALFQVAAVLGAPVGAYTQGGRRPGALSRGGRVVAGVSVILLMLMAASFLAAAGYGPLMEFDIGVRDALWVFTSGYSVVGAVLNLLTPSRKERMVFGPTSLVLLTLVVGINVV
jgi:hypothetical protein